MEPSDQSLNGSGERCLATAFEEHRRRVFRAAFRVTGNVADAEDVLQTVFLNVLKRDTPGGVDLGRSPKSYLCRAAVNAAVDVLRARRRAAHPTEEASESEDPASGADAEVWRRDIRRRLRAGLARLAPRAASIVALRYFEGYGNVEIATMLDTSASSIAVTLHRARQVLKAELEEVAP